MRCSGEDASSEFSLTSSAAVDRLAGVCGRSSSDSSRDCRLGDRWSSSSSSAISPSRRLRELTDDAVDPDAACKEQAADSFVSLNSLAVEISKMVSYGENRSQTALKWTATRAGLPVSINDHDDDNADGRRSTNRTRLSIKILPCISREQSSGRYLTMTFLLRYRRKPYSGLSSSKPAMTFRISTMPPFPFSSSSTSSRLEYLRRNLKT